MELTIPVYQIVLLLFLSTVALLFGKTKLALLTNYVFAMYWGYFLNRDMIMAYMDQTYFMTIYFGLGLFIVIVAMIGFLSHRE
jgi:hypothetical protein